ncbi:MAG TPA: VTT domain-containing protein [Gemmataceae bacterium]|jgi:membrane-associated protein|nr:VTT domain-containing protein [Gemmataceae bacterium]
MERGSGQRHKNAVRALTWALLAWIGLAITASCVAAQAPGAGTAAVDPPPNDAGFVMQILSNLFNSRALLTILEKPEFALTAFVALNVIVFVETGLLIGFFLPGDSLLVIAGMACFTAHWNLPLLLTSLCASAIVGDSVGYAIGLRTGPKIFNREKSWFFNKEHLLKAHAFYEKHGGKTIILARFMPIIRTFAPVVAGVARMDYRKFLFFNVIGGAGWVLSMILLGYSLPNFLNRAFQDLLGNPQFEVQDHIEKIVILVVVLSISPGIYVWLRSRLKKGPPLPPAAPLQELAKAK